jgi:DNA-binding winged helix-turn-helix (wHTH) protein
MANADELAEWCSQIVQEADSASGDRATELGSTLCRQLDRVLNELWAFAAECSKAESVALAKLSLRLCSLYPQPTASSRQRVVLGERVLELHGIDEAHGGEALFGRTRVHMTHRETALLRYLLSNRERIISREELMKEVWRKHAIGERARTVDIHVHRLRCKLGQEFADRLETIRSGGYRLSLARSDSERVKNTAKSSEPMELEELAAE